MAMKAIKATKAAAPPKAMKAAKAKTYWWSIDTRCVRQVELKNTYVGKVNRIEVFKCLADGARVVKGK